MAQNGGGECISRPATVTSQQHYRLVMLGEAAVGKTSLVTRYIKEAFNENSESTIGASFFPGKKIVVGDRAVVFDIWDTAGQDRFDCIAPMYYRGANAALVVYDVTNRNSLEKAKHWVKKLQTEVSPSVVIALAGNKCDLETRAIEPEEGQHFADDNGLIFMESSAKSGVNVHRVFQELARNMPDSSKTKTGPAGNVRLVDNNKVSMWVCCGS